MVPRRLLVVLALLVIGVLGIGVTTAVKRSGDDRNQVASPDVTSSPEPEPEPEPTFSSEPTDLPTVEPSPVVPTEAPSPTVSPTSGTSGSGSGSGSSSGGSNQALGPGAPSTPETGPVAAVMIVGALSAMGAVVVRRRYFR